VHKDHGEYKTLSTPYSLREGRSYELRRRHGEIGHAGEQANLLNGCFHCERVWGNVVLRQPEHHGISRAIEDAVPQALLDLSLAQLGWNIRRKVWKIHVSRHPSLVALCVMAAAHASAIWVTRRAPENNRIRVSL